ncbi:hypothetical protein AMATHDRAFT_69838 [Amanita thiersii Skay4041]|uniref:Uncharacterized protein n=1 Tax=Amanita thiersii Skay4041 TaxID=703135 RepID=A0A2A9NFG0_9AGAR|nr:hypothetical protein AMATHDRAFT_69838 [Amanita thiersii Skay4041]
MYTAFYDQLSSPIQVGYGYGWWSCDFTLWSLWSHEIPMKSNREWARMGSMIVCA